MDKELPSFYSACAKFGRRNFPPEEDNIPQISGICYPKHITKKSAILNLGIFGFWSRGTFEISKLGFKFVKHVKQAK